MGRIGRIIILFFIIDAYRFNMKYKYTGNKFY